MIKKVIPNNMGGVIDNSELRENVRNELSDWRTDQAERSCEDFSEMSTWEAVSTCNEL